MKQVLFISCYFISLIACKNISVQKEEEIKELTHLNVDVLTFLKDSSNLFKEIEEIELGGQISNANVNMHYYSIPEEEFFLALCENRDNIRFFDNNTKINEKRINQVNRHENGLRVGDDINYIYLVDLTTNKYHHARNFFLEDWIDPYYIIKRIQFEDSETILWNSKTGEEDLYLLGVTSSTNVNSLVFYSVGMYVTLQDDGFNLSLFRIDSGRIDAIIETYANWYTTFPFFDKTGTSIYYIHHFLENYKVRSTYAKMDIELL